MKPNLGYQKGEQVLTQNVKKIIISVSLIMTSWAFASETQVELQVKKLNTENENISILEDNSVMFSGDSFQFNLKSSLDLHVYAFFLDSSGMVTLLNLGKSSIKGGESIELPAKDQWYRLDNVIGTETIVVVESKRAQNVVVMEKIVQQRDWDWFSNKGINVKKFTIKHLKPLVSINSSLAAEGVSTNNTQVNKTSSDLDSAIVDYAQKNINNRGPQGSTIQRLIDVANSINTTTRGLKEIHVFKQASPAVVLVTTDGGSGTGSLITNDGLILTNWHVIDGAKKVNVAFMPAKRAKIRRRDFIKAEVIKFNQQSDLALLQIDSTPAGVEPLEFGNVYDIEIGQDVHAIGHPMGGSDWTYTKGYISQILSPHKWFYKDDELEFKARTGIQTQTPINPGNSGGPLLDNDSNIIGVNTYKSTDYDSANYAVSVEDVKSFIKQVGNKNADNKKTRIEEVSEALGLNVVSIEDTDFYGDDSEDKAIEIDNDKNGKVEMVIIVLEDRDKAEIAIFDDDEDGNWDEIIIDEDNNGKSDTHFYNTDEDEEPELVGYDDDEDGEVDRYEEL